MHSSVKSIAFLLGFIFCCHSLLAQSKWEQLEHTLKDSSEKARLGFYITAAKDLFVGNRTTSLAFAEKGMALAKSNDVYVNEAGDLSNLLGIIAMYNEQYAKAEDYLQKALATGRQQNNEPLQLKALANLALNSSKKGAYQQSILQNLQVLPLLEKKGDRVGLANVYANISNAYYYQEIYPQAESYQQKALALFRKANYEYGIANSLNTLFTIASDLKDYKKARSLAEQSLRVKQSLHDSTGIGNVYNNLADLYRKQKMAPQQLATLKKAEAIFAALHEEANLARVYSNLGVYYSGQNQDELASTYERKAISLAQKINDPYVLTNLYHNLSISYAHLRNVDSALAFSKKALTAKDSLTSLSVAQQIANMETKYETEKKERIISQQNGELATKQVQLKERQLELARRNAALTILGVFVLLLLPIGYLLYRKKQWEQHNKMQKALLEEREKAAQTVILAEERERKRIAQDLHDGVGQTLSAIKMNLTAYDEGGTVSTELRRTKLDRIIALVDDSCKEVRTVSHNMMPNALLTANLASALHEFIDKLDNSRLKIHLYTEGLEGPLNANIETVLYRVIQECINNVIKHAGADTVDISIIRDQKEITATIEDNGKGFDTSLARKNGLGLQNMKTRIEYLNGNVTIDSQTGGGGTVVAVNVPL